MGGDGGTISSNRAYLRGAGKADHTADHKRFNASRSKEEESELARTILGSCYISGEAFDLSSSTQVVDIVACPYGRLYKRENVLEALLMRSSNGGEEVAGNNSNNTTFERIMHIRGRKDLHPVRFHVTQENKNRGCVVTCPITGSDIGGGSISSYLIVKSCNNSTKVKDEEDNSIPNVISERGMQEMGIDKLQEEYGPFEKKDLIRLAPQQVLFEEVRKKWDERMEADRLEKLNKKKEKKRKRTDDHASKKTSSSKGSNVASTLKKNSDKHNNAHHPKQNTQQQTSTKVSSSLPTAAQEARSSVRSAVESNPVLSNLFGSKKKNSSEKERRDALFTRNC